MGKPDLVVVANIQHGVMKDGENVVNTYSVGESLPMDGFSEDEIRALISCQAVVDRSGEMQVLKAVPFVDTQTEERDKLLRQAGMPVLVDTSNPLNQGQFPGVKPEDVDADLARENAELRKQLEAAQSVQSSEAAQRTAQAENKQAISKTPIGSTKK